MSRRLPTLAALLFVAASLVCGAVACTTASSDDPSAEAWVEIRGQRIAVEIADTPDKQALGLGMRDDLPWNHGMYFEYARPAYYAFWMKGMRFSIDIVWLRDGRIIDITPNVPFQEGGNGPTVRPNRPANAVLEVPAGYAIANGWLVGDAVSLERVEAN